MSKSKYIDRVCIAVVAAAIVITLLFLSVGPHVLGAADAAPPYAEKLFDNSRVHTLDIVVKEKEWQGMLDNAMDKQYIPCNVIIDGESVKNVAIRTKGASSLLSISMSDSDRYSFKLEFDHYESSKTYHGLDKLALNNIIQDNTYLMDYLAYDMMRSAGVNAPLASFIWITVNGRDWGLYLAVEGIEEAFARRNYGNEPGNFYKPDSDNMLINGDASAPQEIPSEMDAQDKIMQVPENTADNIEAEGDGNAGVDAGADMADGAIGAGDVSLQYSGENPDDYPNIFNNSVFGDESDADKKRLINSLKQLNEQKDLSEVLDIDEVIRYFVAHNFLVNGDSYTGVLVHNYYLREYKGRLSMLPWDYNLSFGGMFMNFAQVGNDSDSYVNAPIDTPVSGGNAVMQTRPMVSWIFSDEQYKEEYHKVFSDFISEYFESGYFEEQLENIVDMISAYVEKDPSAFCTYEEFKKGTRTLKEFCMLRAKSIRGQLNGTIPATIEGQEASPESLVDASSVNLSDMTKGGDIGGVIGEEGDADEASVSAENESQNTVDGTASDAGDGMAIAVPDGGEDTVTGAGTETERVQSGDDNKD